jgi:hypothetical protein
VASTFPPSTIGRARRTTARRATGALFPPVSWWKSKRWPVSCPRAADCHWRTGRSANCAAKPWTRAWWLGSAAPPCGVGSARTRCDRGGIVTGYSRATRLSPSRPVASWTFIIAVGRARPWDLAITCCAPMKKPASKPGGANISLFHQPPVGRSMWNMNMPAPVPAPTSPHGTSTALSCSVAASARPALLP